MELPFRWTLVRIGSSANAVCACEEISFCVCSLHSQKPRPLSLHRKASLGLFLFSLQTHARHCLFSSRLRMHITIDRESYQSIDINRGLRSLCSPDAFSTCRKLPSYLFVCHSLICSFIGSLIFTGSLIHFLLFKYNSSSRNIFSWSQNPLQSRCHDGWLDCPLSWNKNASGLSKYIWPAVPMLVSGRVN